MRIAVIAPPWTPVPPSLYGGIELIVDRLCQGYQKAGHEVLLYTVGESTCPVPRKWTMAEAEGMRIGNVVPELRHVLGAYEAARDYDIVHDHTVVGPIYSARYPRLPVVTTIHGEFNAELTEIYEVTAKRVPVLAVSHAQCRPAPQVPIARVIHHGIDAADFPYGAGDGGYVLFLGRMTEDKGVHRAIEVARKAGIPLRIAAKMRDSWEFEYFEMRVKPHLGDDVQYLGEVPHEHKLELLAGARALLFPIRWNEPFGLVMLEAMACGTPVLAFPEGAAPEVIEHGRTGFLCEDEADMANHLGRVDEINRVICRAAVEGYFSTDRMVREHLEYFELVLSGRH